ncbi:unnamed protein product [Strongylus vulgaris]|uniref:Uncharacterized protein n=1 Tax=Strongylus vulgaris TaxID=40348 RepID=A0A3P7IQU1_STRVU|nr:unnamed protein product [Strongylus vulgaris]
MVTQEKPISNWARVVMLSVTRTTTNFSSVILSR